MPWIDKELCTGCQTCIDECYVGAISMEGNSAFINDDDCIRCGVCHDVCIDDAVRHDGERIPQEVLSNLDWAKKLLSHEYYLNDRANKYSLSNVCNAFLLKTKKWPKKP